MTHHVIDGRGFELISCGECGIEFLAPYSWVVDRRDRGEHGKKFVCPNGHLRIWSEATIDKIRRERDCLQQQMVRVEGERNEAERRAALAEAAKKRIERRVSGGTCPCCTRTFQNLAEHMKTQHPEMAPRQMSKRTVRKRLALPAPSR